MDDAANTPSPPPVPATDAKAPAPWTIKGVSMEARNAAIAAAERARQTQGEWLSRNILLMVKAERAENRMPAVTSGPDTTVGKVTPACSMEDVALAVASLEKLSGLTDKRPSRTVIRAIERQMRANLGA